MLLLFNEADSLSYQDILEGIGIDERELKRVLQSLACGKASDLQSFFACTPQQIAGRWGNSKIILARSTLKILMVLFRLESCRSILKQRM